MEHNLNYYHIFYEVVQYGNISKAAEALYISQPAVSKSITRLEQSLNHQLFIRSKKGVKLTEEGQMLYQHLQTAFSAINEAEQDLYRISHFGMGQLRIGVSTSLCKHILLPYLQDFIEANPHIKVSIECNPTFETIELLKQDKIDIGLVCDTEFQKGYHYTPLRSIHDTFVTTQTYLDNLALREKDLSKENDQTKPEENITLPTMTGLFLFSNPETIKPSSLSLSEKEILEKANLMLLDKENISRIFIDNYFNTNHIQPSQLLEINNMDLLIQFASIGMGVACVVREFVSDYIKSGQVIEIPIDYEIPARNVGFLYKENSLNPTASKFLESI